MKTTPKSLLKTILKPLSFAALPLLTMACPDDAPPPPPPPSGIAGAEGGGPQQADATKPAANSLMALPDDTVVATVNTKPLTRRDFALSVENQLRQLGAPMEAIPRELQIVVENRAYDQMIEREALRQKSIELGHAAPDAAIDEAVAGFRSRLPPEKTLEATLAERGVSVESFRKEIHTNLSVGALLEATDKSITALDEKEAKAIFDQNPKRFTDNRSATGRTILIPMPPNPTAESVEAAKKRAEEIHARVVGKSDAEFAKVAKESSADPRTREKGGDIGTVTSRDLLPGLVEPVLNLKKGQVSAVLPSERGFHIYFGGGVNAGVAKKFADVKAEIIQVETAKRKGDGIQKLITDTVATTKVERVKAPEAMPEPKAPPTLPPPAGGPGAPGGAHGAPPGGAGGHGEVPLPNKDNVLPGAPNPHGGGGAGGALKLGDDQPLQMRK